ncbi:uncharacterized protein LOC111701363 [Eurytemora carolleeae]|uniref:uncharacterized protein LOC111701363 n=1 Tax=Eurytemora carolleeae TaxID=1294199 RepID=UPI000C789DCC|nr:uncharacterized protein LOC111701363 [Eurytemora carolleeae]|eukprot:XP_023328386.1 uncharacterized protein LOC111701363 [Eurytemora affinis]
MYMSDHAIKIDFVFGRQLSEFIVRTMLPTMVANAIGYLTIFFEEDAFEAALGVNLTIVLVIVTMLVEIGKEYSNTTSYIMIQLWMIVSVMMPFLEVLLQTYAFCLRKAIRQKLKTNEIRVKPCVNDENAGQAGELSESISGEEVLNRRKIGIISWILKKGILLGYLSFITAYFSIGIFRH